MVIEPIPAVAPQKLAIVSEVSTKKSNHQAKQSQAIHIAKGFGILLVVLNHFASPDIRPSYWSIFSFFAIVAMPAFFMLSGYLYSRTTEPPTSIASYRTLVFKKIPRLLYPYLAVSVIITVVKLVAGFWFTLQWPVNIMAPISILVDPDNGPVPSLWFIYVLFGLFLVYPLLKMLLRNDWLVLLVSLALSLPAWTSYFALNELLLNLPFFVVGVLIARYCEIDSLSPKAAISGMGALLGLSVASYFGIETFGTFDVEGGISYTAIGGFGGIMVILAATLVTKIRWLAQPLAIAGIYSSVIYLVHTMPLGGVRLLAFGVLDLSPNAFWLVAPFACGAALVVPVVLQRYVIKPGSIWARLILGEVPKKAKPMPIQTAS